MCGVCTTTDTGRPPRGHGAAGGRGHPAPGPDSPHAGSTRPPRARRRLRRADPRGVSLNAGAADGGAVGVGGAASGWVGLGDRRVAGAAVGGSRDRVPRHAGAADGGPRPCHRRVAAARRTAAPSRGVHFPDPRSGTPVPHDGDAPPHPCRGRRPRRRLPTRPGRLGGALEHRSAYGRVLADERPPASRRPPSLASAPRAPGGAGRPGGHREHSRVRLPPRRRACARPARRAASSIPGRGNAQRRQLRRVRHADRTGRPPRARGPRGLP